MFVGRIEDHYDRLVRGARLHEVIVGESFEDFCDLRVRSLRYTLAQRFADVSDQVSLFRFLANKRGRTDGEAA